MPSAPAPGSPISPVMAPGPKDAVTTGLGTGRVWATVGQGILNEVYWPTAGEPQIVTWVSSWLVTAGGMR